MNVRPPSEGKLTNLTATHVRVVQENVALAHENARLAQENALLRMQSMPPPQTMEDAVSAAWGQPLHPAMWCAPPGLGPDSAQGYFDVPAGMQLKAAASVYATKPQQGKRGKLFKAIASSFKAKGPASVPCSLNVSEHSPSSFATTGIPSTFTSSFGTVCSDVPASVTCSFGPEEVGEEAMLHPPPPSGAPPPPMTTVMMRNLPNNYSRAMLLELMDDEGFNGAYDFIYLPIDFSSTASFGYAFINFVSPPEAERFREHFQNFSKWSVTSEKVCDVTWSNVHQGLAAHIDRYRSSPVMHDDMPDECKPAAFANGKRAPFPPPLKKIRAPRIRHR